MVSDPIADMLTRIKNGINRKKASVLVPHSKVIEDIAKLLRDKTIIEGYSVVTTEDDSSKIAYKQVKVDLAYDREGNKKVSRITDLKRVSSPGVRYYTGYRKMNKVRSGFGVAVVSTSRGLMTDVEARREKIGGEILFEIW